MNSLLPHEDGQMTQLKRGTKDATFSGQVKGIGLTSRNFCDQVHSAELLVLCQNVDREQAWERVLRRRGSKDMQRWM